MPLLDQEGLGILELFDILFCFMFHANNWHNNPSWVWLVGGEGNVVDTTKHGHFSHEVTHPFIDFGSGP
jgi:hypothetical protein